MGSGSKRSPMDNMLICRIIDSVNKYKLIEKGDGVVVGVSGGPDSVCLLHALCSLSEQLNIRIYAVHINHMLRGEESIADQRYVEDLCEKLGIPLYVRTFDIKSIAAEKGISLEEAGREVRYREFEKVCKEVGADKIAVAHNRNDQAETVLMHIIRGAGTGGLKGMDFKRGNVIRPLLGIDRKDIEEYCRLHGLSPRTDSTNLESIYTRNKIRLDLIPYINTQFGIDIEDNLCRMSRLIRDEDEFIENEAACVFRESIRMERTGQIWLDIPKLMNSHPAILRRVLRMAVRKIKGDLKGIENVHIEAAADLCILGETGKLIHLPSDIRISKSYDTLKVFIDSEKEKPRPFCIPVEVPGITLVEDLEAALIAEITTNGGSFSYKNMGDNRSLIQYFDYNSLNDGIYIRNRRNGDVFKPFKSRGTKKLKEYFIDSKIPRDARDKIPLIASGNEIVWIIGHKISDKFKVSENTKSILKLEYKVDRKNP